MATTFADLKESCQSLYEHFGALLMRNAMRDSDVTDDCLMLYLLNNNEQDLLLHERATAMTDFGRGWKRLFNCIKLLF